MKNKYSLASIPIFVGIICLMIYKVTTRIEPDGTLREPFYLLPFGGLLVIIGFILIVFIGIVSIFKKQNNE
ncbi:DUF3955 domain-containing protein [Bacillus cereus]|uniref:DUF3955 domain-containing protein n=1 Tax=Bacillus cereus TaxID=1396 RepID=UPI001A7E6FB4|nr:DUF3955 domain-containing protein [Bacillus cereus]MBG9617619.1 group-specific protein [Bacillus cereus]